MTGGRKKRKNRDEKSEETITSLKEKSDFKKDKESNKMPFDAWFGLTLGPKKAWLRDSIKAHMEAKGLSESEEKEKFDKAYSKF